MKLLIVFEAEKLPRHYHFLFTSVIKNALQVSNDSMKKTLYDFTEGRVNKTVKKFTGFVDLSNYRLENDDYIIDGNVRLTISTPDTEFLLNLYNGFVNKKNYQYKTYTLQVSHIKVLQEKLPKTSRALFKTNSPIVIKNKEGKFLDIEDPSYQIHLNYIANECIKQIENRLLYTSIKLTPVVMHKKVVQLKHDSFKKLNPQKILYMNAYEGSFVLEGDSRDVAILTQAGLGFRRSELFGSIEFVNE